MSKANERRERAQRAEQMRKDREKAARKQRNMITVGIVVVVVALIAGATWAIQSASKDNSLATKLVEPKNVAADYTVTYDAAAAGADEPKSEPVEVIAYEDFQCPACRAFETESGAWMKQAVAAGEITVQYRPIAFLDRASTTEYSTRSMNAALCVLDQKGVGAYMTMHDALYANQPDEGGAGLTDTELASMAEDAGATDVTSCVKTQKFGPWIDDATQKAQDDEVSATPTVKVAGKDVGSQGVPRLAELQQAVAAAKQA